jgi:hypothetical protein
MQRRPSPLRFLAALVLCAFLTAQATLAASLTTGDLYGVVTDSAGGKPLAQVTVHAVSPSGNYTAQTDAQGRYLISNVAPDTYTVTFSMGGRTTVEIPGVTIVAGARPRLDTKLEVQTIGRVRVVRPGGAFTPNEPIDRITVNERQITTIQGKAFNQDETNLLRSLPSITQDKSGTISVRGGFAFQTAYEYEGIDYTTPSANLQNTLQNIGNFNLINGLGSVQIIPGGGDATHGNTGTGLVSFTAKRGTYPATIGVDLESTTFPFSHQAGVELSWADPSRRWSNYFSFIGANKYFQYGDPGVSADLLGTRGTNAATLNTFIDPNLVYYSPLSRSSRDFVDNFVVRLGRDMKSSLQVFFHGQAIREGLDYGGFQNLFYPSAGSGKSASVRKPRSSRTLRP